jgi:hypothetical protein
VASDVIAGMQQLLASTLGPQIQVRIELNPARAAVLSERTQLELAILNLAINARDAMPDGGELTISVKSVRIESDAELTPGDYVRKWVNGKIGSGKHCLAESFTNRRFPTPSWEADGKQSLAVPSLVPLQPQPAQLQHPLALGLPRGMLSARSCGVARNSASARARRKKGSGLLTMPPSSSLAARRTGRLLQPDRGRQPKSMGCSLPVAKLQTTGSVTPAHSPAPGGPLHCR